MSQEDKEMEEAVKKVGGNLQYKVLTKEEYDILMAGTALRASTPKQPIPSHGPKFTLQPRAPGAIGASRLRQIFGASHNQSSFSAAPVYNPPSFLSSVVLRNPIRVKPAMKSGTMKLNAFKRQIIFQKVYFYTLSVHRSVGLHGNF